MKKLLVIGFLIFNIIALSCNKIFSSPPGNIENNLEIEIVVKDIPLLLELENNEIISFTVHNKPEQTQKITGVSIKFSDSDIDKILETLRLVEVNKINSEEFKTEIGRTSNIRQTTKIVGEYPLDKNDQQFILSFTGYKNANLNSSIRIEEIEFRIDNQSVQTIDIPNNKVIRLGRALRQGGQDNCNTYRIPGLATTNKGTLIAVYDNRYDNGKDLQNNINIGMSRSTNGGQSWEPMKVIMDMDSWGGYGEDGNGVGDPSILVDKNTRTIWVAALWAHGYVGKTAWGSSGPGLEPTETGQLLLVKSEDDGVTWSDPVNITKQVKKPEWRLFLQGPGKGITLSNGTLVFPAQFKDENNIPHSTLIYSTDHGENWHVGTGVRAKTTEAQLVELKNGKIMINCRNDEARDNKGVGRVVATTNDLGMSWEIHPSSIVALEEPTCMASLIYESFNEYGDILLFSNPNDYSKRFNITIKASKDEAMTWPEKYWLLINENRSAGYSCMTKVDDKHIGILYEGGNLAHLIFQKIPIKDILEQK